MNADDLNRLLPMPADTWALDFEPYHVIAGGFAGAESLAAQARSGYAWTLVHRGRVAAVWGLVVGRGVAEGWLITNREECALLGGVRFTRGAARFVEAAHEALNLRRIQVHVQIPNAPFCQWAKLAGFQQEAVLRRYMPDGSDAMLMARVW